MIGNIGAVNLNRLTPGKSTSRQSLLSSGAIDPLPRPLLVAVFHTLEPIIRLDLFSPVNTSPPSIAHEITTRHDVRVDFRALRKPFNRKCKIFQSLRVHGVAGDALHFSNPAFDGRFL